MNGSAQRTRLKLSPVKPLAFAVGLALSGIATLPESVNAYPIDQQQPRDSVYATQASSIPESVNTNQVTQQYPRDSIYAMQPSSTDGGRDALEPLSTQLSKWAAQTESFAVDMRDKTTSFLRQDAAPSPNEPQRYGRAGGFVGLEKFS